MPSLKEGEEAEVAQPALMEAVDVLTLESIMIEYKTRNGNQIRS